MQQEFGFDGEELWTSSTQVYDRNEKVDPQVEIDARDQAMHDALNAADPEWVRVAVGALYDCARKNPTFTVDDVWPFIPQGVETAENRSMGGIMMKGRSVGWMETTDRYTPSVRSGCHRHPRVVWKSKIHPANFPGDR